MAHSVKGTGGTIGARDLFAHAKEPEESIRGRYRTRPSGSRPSKANWKPSSIGIAAAFPPHL